MSSRRTTPAAVVVYDRLCDAFPELVVCLETEAVQSVIALAGQQIYWRGADAAGLMVACGQ